MGVPSVTKKINNNKQMKYIFELNHPKHYYQFKYIMLDLVKGGHKVKVLARNKDVLLKVLEEEKWEFQIFGSHKKSIQGKIVNTIGLIINYIKIVRKYKPEVIISKASFYGVFVSRLFNIRSIIFPDSEVVWVTNKIVVPLASMIITPDSFELDFGKKHKRIRGFFENCYLHPAYFQPESKVIEKYQLQKPYSIIRFIGWTANHDLNAWGFSAEEKTQLVNELEKFGNVYISSENILPKKLEKYKLPVPASKIHHVLHFANLYIGDSQTMATEAAILGTPAIRSNSFVGPKDMSNFKILEKEYSLLFNYALFSEVLAKSKELFSKPNYKQDWLDKREKYFGLTGNANEEILELISKD